VNNQTLKPLDEYMLFTKTDAENILVLNPSGVRSAQCNSQFEVKQKLIHEPLMNISQSVDKTWNVDSPARKPYKSIYVDNDEKEEQTQFVFIVLITLFIVIIICCIIEVYRTDKQHKKRIERETDESIIWSKEQAAKMHESPGSRKFSYKPVAFEDPEKPAKSSEPLVGILKNGSAPKPSVGFEAPPKENNAGIRGKWQDI
jgi:hypothetical protein